MQALNQVMDWEQSSRYKMVVLLGLWFRSFIRHSATGWEALCSWAAAGTVLESSLDIDRGREGKTEGEEEGLEGEGAFLQTSLCVFQCFFWQLGPQYEAALHFEQRATLVVPQTRQQLIIWLSCLQKNLERRWGSIGKLGGWLDSNQKINCGRGKGG